MTQVETSAMTTPEEVQVRRAVLSVFDKRGVVEFARGLVDLGVEIISTGGTAEALTDAGISVRPIEEFTGSPEMLGGRLKTLHPKLYGGLLAVRDDDDHMDAVRDNDIELVDLICVNLYPFEAKAARRGVSDSEVIENIDIGGPTMIRAAAKNFRYSAVVVKPESYDAVLAELRDGDGRLSLSTRENLATEAFAYTARYETAIARWFVERRDDFPSLLLKGWEKVADLPYGENPHQRAGYYAEIGARMHVLSMVQQLGGRELSFNNILDLSAGRQLLHEFEVPTCAIIKHNNPCGCAVAGTLSEAYERARGADPKSAFGGIVCLNRPVDADLAKRISENFYEVVFAPGFSDEAITILTKKEKLRVLEDSERRRSNVAERDLKSVLGGVLIQDRDLDIEDRTAMEVVTESKPNENQWGEMLFAWRICKHVRSNAIVLTKGLTTVGIGAGQMSRVDSVELAITKARAAEHELAGATLASDAFFPFADGPEAAVAAGISCIIQPGGSIRDHEVVEAADKAGIVMVLTHRRHFKH